MEDLLQSFLPVCESAREWGGFGEGKGGHGCGVKIDSCESTRELPNS